MKLPFILFSTALLVGDIALADSLFAFNSATQVETRSIDEIYQAALAEGGIVTCWHGGDEPGSGGDLKSAFESRFPGMTLNITIDLSKYHDVRIDEQLAGGNVYVDSVILQTLHDYPRWDKDGALLHYAPPGFDKISVAFKDVRAAYYGMYIFGWSTVWNTNKISQGPVEWPDFLNPEFKDKLVLTYPNDDDAVLYAFDLILQQYGSVWFDSLLAQNPRWVRGTATPVPILAQDNTSWAVTFTTSVGLSPSAPLNVSLPTQGQFVTWPQTAAILKDAPHPEGAKLLHSFMLSPEYQNATGTWSPRRDIPPPAGASAIEDQPGTNVAGFARWMEDRPRVERLRFWFENKIGTAQGLSPLIDGL